MSNEEENETPEDVDEELVDGEEIVDLDDDAIEDIDDLEGDDLEPEFEAADEVAVETVVEEEDDDDDDDESRPRARRTAEEDDEDEEEDPDDVEADLDEILRDRLAASDDDEDDEDEADDGVKPADVAKQRNDEFVCGTCFLVVSQAQRDIPCPMGDGVEPHSQLPA